MILTPIELAKGFITFPSSTNTAIQAQYDIKINKAYDIALANFTAKYSKYKKIKYLPSTNISSLGLQSYNGKLKIFLPKSIIKRVEKFNEIEILTDPHQGLFKVLEVNKNENFIVIDEEFESNIALEIEMTELKIYNTALAWYICSYATFTHQEIKDLKVLVSATQKGNGEITAYSYADIKKFRKDMQAEGDKLLFSRNYPTFK